MFLQHALTNHIHFFMGFKIRLFPTTGATSMFVIIRNIGFFRLQLDLGLYLSKSRISDRDQALWNVVTF